eukprot:CAMPEP_0183463392 /NCGR_PEP_ID=MMETSP0370-20130417/143485_1 /TAXON_ID=268820 /ORGANISM="Peridinium aciculiferum, Strain PAER-2" /LENGTH=53 /DNA_ID=CAMNT_0025655501 /DNA_START=26 /DNA_END=184 /DNA_ORIENTATION=-
MPLLALVQCLQSLHFNLGKAPNSWRHLGQPRARLSRGIFRGAAAWYIWDRAWV